MATKAEGIWDCKVIDGGAFEGSSPSETIVRINVQHTSGPDAGQRSTYEDTLNTKSEKYIRWSAEAAGWSGRTFGTLANDIAEWVKKTGGASTVEIKHIEVKRGKAYDKWVAGGCIGPGPVWDKVAGIGRGAPRALKPLSAAGLKEADDILRMANPDGGAPDDRQPAGDDIPFATISSISLGEIAKVLR
jgi:hypothetical protein